MDISIVLLCAFVTGYLLDCLFGDPVSLPHPIVYFGKCITFFEHRFNQGSHRLFKGAVVAVLLILATYLITNALVLLAENVSVYLYYVVVSIGVFYCLAAKTLLKEVELVFHAADDSLEKGRKQVARIVGRDTDQLSDQEVRTAALETLAENLSDGVVAPMFWFVLFGLPGMMTYKMVNTLDSMIGYQNERYLLFGRWAAKIDDAFNYIPARLTALLMVAVSGKWHLVSFIRTYGSQHASPNSGYPESALAGILDCRFGGTHNYFGKEFYKPYIGHTSRILTTQDMLVSIHNARFTTLAAVVLCIITRYCANLI